MGIIEFYCQKYFLKFGIKPVRIGKEDKFQIGEEIKTLEEIGNCIYPKRKMTEEAKEKLKGYNGIKKQIKKRAMALLKNSEKEMLLV